MKMIAIIAVTIATLAPAKPKHRPRPCSHGNELERRHCKAHRLCSNRRPMWCIVNAEIHFRLDRWQRAWMRRVSWCESRHNPHATGGPNLGQFQFNRDTWARLPRRYSSHSAYESKYASLAAAFMLVSGRSGEWACS